MSEQKTPGLGARFNAGKTRWDLLAWGPLTEVANVATYGSIKYAEENWRAGLKYKETFGSMMRHAVSWFLGEERDPESGCHHLAHVIWNAMVLLEFIMEGRTDLDNRPAMAPYPTTENIKSPPVRMGANKEPVSAAPTANGAG